jgi:type 1 glutamine amidotransferase
MTFDQEVLGGSYKNHYGNVPAMISLAPGAAGHAILAGVDPAQLTAERLYRNATIAPSANALLMGRSQGEQNDEHVAWTNQVGKSRVFYTSLGAPADFQKPAFRRLLSNAVSWALAR